MTKPYLPRLLRNRIAAQLSLSRQQLALYSQALDLADEIDAMRHALGDAGASSKVESSTSVMNEVLLTADELRYLTAIVAGD